MNVLVVVPTYNEAGNLSNLAQHLFGLHIPALELLVVDDNSPDGTAAAAEALDKAYPGRVHVLRRPRKEGLGPAYVAGFREALRLQADVIIQMDADLSHPPECIPAMLESIKGCDVAVGSRYIPGGGVASEWGVARRFLSRGGDMYVRWVIGLHIQDTKSGFKAFQRRVLEQVPLEALRSKGYIFQAELMYRCQQMGFSVQEVPYVFQERKSGGSKMSVNIVMEALWRSFQVRLTRLRTNGKEKG
ncbi:MAG: polyprenol monophosphomannose synthase [Dehalococcoidia bacterium]|nr:polyprenol monophosphomannose synthase [Dehalococcoidia bacterium]